MHKHTPDTEHIPNTSINSLKEVANRQKEKENRNRATEMVECGFTPLVIPRFVYTPRSEVKF